MKDRKGFAVWLTGLPASGKSSIAKLLEEKLRSSGERVQILDSDDLRKVLTPEPNYSREERNWFYRSLVHIAKLLTQQGVNVIIAATGHRRIFRDWARAAIEEFAEVYVNCFLSTCIRRDEKGIYKYALSHTGSTVPGINEMYEVPLDPEIVLDSESKEPPELAEEAYQWCLDFLIEVEQPEEMHLTH